MLRTTWDWTEPTLFVAVQRYCPASASVTRSILSMAPFTCTWSGSGAPTLLQCTVGTGSPSAWHSNSTEVPTVTVCTDVRTLIITLGNAVVHRDTPHTNLDQFHCRYAVQQKTTLDIYMTTMYIKKNKNTGLQLIATGAGIQGHAVLKRV